jgi:hypothetical protein
MYVRAINLGPNLIKGSESLCMRMTIAVIYPSHVDGYLRGNGFQERH